jgi:hypothetical protein
MFYRHAFGILERCQSGRSGRSRKPLTFERRSVGSNPTLSAVIFVMRRMKGGTMRKWLLLIIVIVLGVWALSQRYQVVSGRTPNGTYNVIVVDKTAGTTYRLMGK